MNHKTRKIACAKKAKNSLNLVMKIKTNKRRKVKGPRKLTRKQQNKIIKNYVKTCVKDSYSV